MGERKGSPRRTRRARRLEWNSGAEIHRKGFEGAVERSDSISRSGCLISSHTTWQASSDTRALRRSSEGARGEARRRRGWGRHTQFIPGEVTVAYGPRTANSSLRLPFPPYSFLPSCSPISHLQAAKRRTAEKTGFHRKGAKSAKKDLCALRAFAVRVIRPTTPQPTSRPSPTTRSTRLLGRSFRRHQGGRTIVP